MLTILALDSLKSTIKRPPTTVPALVRRRRRSQWHRQRHSRGWIGGKGEDNKFYFIRLRYGNGSVHDGTRNSDGIGKLLRYLTNYIQCENKDTAMDSSDLRDKNMATAPADLPLHVLRR